VRWPRLLVAATLAAGVAVTGCGGSSGTDGAGSADIAAPATGDCVRTALVNNLTQHPLVACNARHEGQVYAVIALPPTITDPSVHQQVTAARQGLTCPDVKAWAGYKGTVPLGLFRTWRFPTKQQIAAGAHWVACVAILAPGPDHKTLTSTVGTLSGKLAGVSNPLPRLGQCAAAHTNSAFTPITCVPGSSQWVWLGAHRKPAGAFPGRPAAKRAADQGCLSLVSRLGSGGAFVYYPTSAAVWARTRADWSCWMPLAHVKA
jgi:hypothetical protein